MNAVVSLVGLFEGTFVVFLRIGATLMLLPGFGSMRVPVRARLALALVLAYAIAPLVPAASLPVSTPAMLRLIGSELLVGAALGLLVRAHFEALRTLASTGAAAIGFNALGGIITEANEPDGPLTALVALCALATLFAFDFHHVALRALVMSFESVGFADDTRSLLVMVTDALLAAFALALALFAPVIVYAILAQLALGLVNKLAPAVPLYFIAMPAIIFGGLVLLARLIPAILAHHAGGLEAVIEGPGG